MKKSLVILPVLFVWLHAVAQEKAERINQVKNDFGGTGYVIAGIESSTTAYINTKTGDSSGTAPYLSFYANYHNKNHLGVKAKTYLLPGGSNSGFFLTSLTGYYANFSRRVMPVVSYTRHLQSTNPSVPYSPIQNEILAQVQVSSDIIEPSVGVDWGFGKDSQDNNNYVYDINAFAAISHIFFVSPSPSNITLALIPTLQANAGTDQYYSFMQTSKYVSRNRSVNYLLHGSNSAGANRGGNMNNGGMSASTTETVINQSNQFSLSNLETNLAVIFITGRFSIEPSGSVYFPLRGTDKTLYGYWQLNVNFTIK